MEGEGDKVNSSQLTSVSHQQGRQIPLDRQGTSKAQDNEDKDSTRGL